MSGSYEWSEDPILPEPIELTEAERAFVEIIHQQMEEQIIFCGVTAEAFPLVFPAPRRAPGFVQS